MKQTLSILLLFLLQAGRSDPALAQPGRDNGHLAQTDSNDQSGYAPTRLVRIYEDNDFINIYSQATDNAYTNGTRIDFFYTKKNPPRFFIDRLMPKAGDSSTNVYGWGLMQLMFTPDDLTTPDYQPNDYPYSGALFATHTLYSYNQVRKYDLQTELVLGVMGPPALDRQTQSLIHDLFDYPPPKGWGTQLGTDALININFTAEKELFSWRMNGHETPLMEFIGGGQAFVGTMLNGLTVYPMIRIGLMNAYFRGYLDQYSGRTAHRSSRSGKKIQAYLIVKPVGQVIFSNALMEGALFTHGHTFNGNGKGSDQDGTTTTPTAGSVTTTGGPSHRDLNNFVFSMNYGAVVAAGHFSLSFIQNSTTALMKGLYNHEVGNVSAYYSW